MKVTLEKEVRFCRECPYFGMDGGPGPVMVCEHPKAPDQGYIISHPVCDTGFPEKCPLMNPSIMRA